MSAVQAAACLRESARIALQHRAPADKCAATDALPSGDAAVFPDRILETPAHLPCRLERPELVSVLKVPKRSVHTVEGRAALLHSIAHIELNAIDLALDIMWRFPHLPKAFYHDWARVAQEEAKHFRLLNDHLAALGYQYGDFPAHNGLWDAAEKSKHDILARLALVPCTLEARGLDASPAVRDKLLSAGDKKGAEILDLILEEEIGHVAIGNRWFHHVCAERGLNPTEHYRALLTEHMPDYRLRAPINVEARKAAGGENGKLLLV